MVASSSNENTKTVTEAALSEATRSANAGKRAASLSSAEGASRHRDCDAPAAVSPAADRIQPIRQAKKRFLSPLPLALCLSFVLVRLPFIFTVPMVEAPDEFAHYWVTRFLHDYGRLPNAHEVAAGGPSAVYGSLPQFGYIPHILVGALFPANDFVLFARFGSLLMGLVLMVCAFELGKELFAGKRILALALPLAVIFHPQLAFVHTYTNNDATSSAVASVLLLLAIRSLRTGLKLVTSVLIGVLVGWLVLTKYAGLAVMPAVALCLVAAAIINKVSLKDALANFFAAGAVAAAICGVWFVRNSAEYSGDFMGTKTMYASWAATFHRPKTYYLPPSHIIKDIRWWRMMFFSFWGLFGYMNKYMWRPAYFVYLGYLVSAAFGGVLSLAGTILRRENPSSGAAVGGHPTGAITASKTGSPPIVLWNRQVDPIQARNMVAWTSLVLCVVINLTLMIWASTANLGGPQGRYLFTSELPVLALMLAGIHRCGARWGDKLVLSFLLFNAAVCIAVWFWLCHLYGFHCHPI